LNSFFDDWTGKKFKNGRPDDYMDIEEKVEKLLNVKIVKTETVRRAFPLFDLAEIRGIRLALIKNPSFVIIGDDVYEKRVEGEFVVVQNGDEYLLMKYEGEPNVDALRAGVVEETKTEEVEQKEEEAGEQEAEEETGKEEDKERKDKKDLVEEILSRLPKWASGAVVVEKDGNIIVLPVKRSTKGEGYYASVTWRPLDVQGAEGLLNHMVMKNRGTVKVNVRVGDKYINIYTHLHPRKGRKYSRS
jgi:hypothetical protein